MKATFNGLVKRAKALPRVYFNHNQSDVAAQWSAGAGAARRAASTFAAANLTTASTDADSLADSIEAVSECIAGAETPTGFLAARFVFSSLWRVPRPEPGRPRDA
jgi:hypothetical protein